MTLSVYLQPSLAGHRRGRLLRKLLKAQATENNLPEAGVLLMPGQEFQALETDQQKPYFDWCSQPGRTLLLIPPFNEKAVSESIDWHLAYREPPAAENENILSGLLADEVNQSLLGTDGAFDSEHDQQWPDLSPNCRYLKRHAATGVFAVTVLPLWSISLLGHGELLKSWLQHLHSHAGKASDSAVLGRGSEQEAEVVIAEVAIKDADYTTMVCIHAWACKTTADLTEKLYAPGGIPIFSIERNTLEESLKRLRLAKLLSDDESLICLSKAGIETLEASPFLAYVDSLREAL